MGAPILALCLVHARVLRVVAEVLVPPFTHTHKRAHATDESATGPHHLKMVRSYSHSVRCVSKMC
jgi:hypothetical protein